MSGPLDLVRRMRSPGDLTTIDALRTLDAVARRTFADPRLVQWAGRYATYTGSSPYRAPATLACIPAVESRYGVWYPAGGMGALRDALVRVAARMGVELGPGIEVERIEAAARPRPRRRASDGTRTPRRRGRGQRRRRAPLPRPAPRHRGAVPHPPRRAIASGFVVLAGVGGTRPDRPTTTCGSRTTRPEFRPARRRGRAGRPPHHLRLRAVGHRPQPGATGPENWFLLVNAPAGATVDRTAYQEHLFDLLAGSAPTSATACASPRRSRPPTWPTGTGRRVVRSTARPRTAGGPRSSGRPTGGRAAASTSSAARAIPVVASRSWPSVPGSWPT